MVRLLGARAPRAFGSPQSSGVGALVRLPPGVAAGDVGLRAAGPGIARVWGTPAGLLAFADAHPELPMEVTPPMRRLLDSAATFVRVPRAAPFAPRSLVLDGTGVAVGIADTGVDLTHPDFLDASGKTRVAWLIDLGAPPRGVWPQLESQYGLTDATTGAVEWGAVWSADDINAALASNRASLPQDGIGHGTLVTSCAAGNGSGGTSIYRGIAPGATIVLARILDSSGNVRSGTEILGGIQFLFDRADFLHLPVVVNLSIGSDFGPHDGTTLWEQSLASHVGPSSPGHVVVAAAGNGGSIAPGDAPIHNNVFVPKGTTIRVPIVTSGAQSGSVSVWVAMHPGASVHVGLDGPDGTWISPVEPGHAKVVGTETTAYQAEVINGSEPKDSPVPAQSHGAVVIWLGNWPKGLYTVTLEGSGNVDLYLQGAGDAVMPGAATLGFLDGVREATVSLPATHPDILAVGCTINKTAWTSINHSHIGLGHQVPLLDAAGGMPNPQGMQRAPIEGEPCWFSGAGPTLTGVQKPEIMAPGAAIVGALSSQAVPPAPASIFTVPCPNTPGGQPDPQCSQVDAAHAVSLGTSFSAPIVAGAVAVLLQQNPALTQGQARALLQGGAHRLRGPAPFDDQAGAGELDVLGSLAAANETERAAVIVPSRTQSWLSLGAEYCIADGSTPLQAVLLLRGDQVGNAPAPAAAGFDTGRLAMYAHVSGVSGRSGDVGGSATLEPRGAGVWLATVLVPSGLGSSTLTLGATFDGVDVVDPKTLPIATDHWNADYPPQEVMGGCAVARQSRGHTSGGRTESGLLLAAAGTFFLGGLRRLRRRLRMALGGGWQTPGPLK
jgi:subtilisin family serine protease